MQLISSQLEGYLVDDFSAQVRWETLQPVKVSAVPTHLVPLSRPADLLVADIMDFNLYRSDRE